MTDRTVHLAGVTIASLCESVDARLLLCGSEPATDEDVAEAALDLALGRADPDVAARADALRASSAVRLPAGFGELLPHVGLDPVGMHALMLLIPHHMVMVVEGDGEDETTLASIGIHAQDMTSINLAADDASLHLHWREDDLMMRALPETIAALLVGRRLADLISHPALDPLDLTITGVEDCWEDERFVFIETSMHAERTREMEEVHSRVEAALSRLVAGRDDVEGIEVSMLAGFEEACILVGLAGKPIAVNPEIVRNHDDDALERLLAPWMDAWKAQAR